MGGGGGGEALLVIVAGKGREGEGRWGRDYD